MDKLYIQLWQTNKGCNVMLKNNTLIVHDIEGGMTEELLHSRKDIRRVLAEEYNLPRLPVDEAIDTCWGSSV